MATALNSGFSGAIWLVWSGVFGFVGVGAGAFGAHALRGVLNERMLQVYQTAVQYQLLHALALAVVSVLLFTGSGGVWPRRAAFCFVAGTLLFSGSLYLLCLTGIGWLGAITPLGGVLFLCGWLALCFAGLHARSNRATDTRR